MTNEDRSFATAAIAREHGERTLLALPISRALLPGLLWLAARGRDWYDSDTDDIPRLACEALIIIQDAATRIPRELRVQHPEIPGT